VKKPSLSDAVKIKGSVSKRVKYGLYIGYTLVFVVLWQMNTGTVLSPFSEILSSLYHLWVEKGLSHAIGISLKLNFTALFITLIITLITSYIAILPLFQPIPFAFSKGRFLGLLGLHVFFIQIFGLGFGLKVALLTFGTTVFYLTSMYTIITEIPQSQFDYARALGLSRWQIVWQVVIRGTAAEMLEAFRQNAAIGWMMITAVEIIVRAGGVGVTLFESYRYGRRGEVLAIIFCILTIGLIQDACLRALQGIITPHTVAVSHRRSSSQASIVGRLRGFMLKD
jgi:NitT/TauT family transport system permease protein